MRYKTLHKHTHKINRGKTANIEYNFVFSSLDLQCS